MKNWKKAIAICASAAAMASMAACGGGSSDGDSSSSKSDKKTIGFVAVGPEGGFRTANENDLKKAFEDAGFDLVYSPTQNNDQQKQIQAFNKFVNDEVDAIVLSATNDSGWDDCLENAAEAEIPVFTVDRNIDIKSDAAKKAVVSHIGPSNVWAGEQAAEFVNKSFPDGANGFILDGVPRTIAQAEAIETMGIRIDKVLELSVADDVIVERMSGRRVCEKCGASYHIINKKSKVEGVCDLCGGKTVIRKDDQPATVLDRLKAYHEQTEPLVAFYRERGKLAVIPFCPSIEETTAEVMKALEA